LINSAYTWLMAMLSCSASLTSSHEGEGNEKIPLRADKDDPDPDIFVLGFQELDLSAEALIYYASTAREDAWCHAIFAALGEKAIKYEKVRHVMFSMPSN
jgi:inositol polyphosphate 5-phosphatase INPP5B/F